MGTLASVPWLAVIVAAAVSFVIGGLWYGPLFGKPWRAETGMTEEKAAAGNMARTFGVAFVCQLIAATVMATLMGAMMIGAERSLTSGLLFGLTIGVAFVITSAGVNDLFEQRSLKLWMINSGNNLVAYSVMGAIIGFW